VDLGDDQVGEIVQLAPYVGAFSQRAAQIDAASIGTKGSGLRRTRANSLGRLCVERGMRGHGPTLAQTK
jgi:hypothetical protein